MCYNEVVRETATQENQMKVHIVGPNLPDQSKGSFHVHQAGCADIAKMVARHGPQDGWETEVDSKIAVAVDVYGHGGQWSDNHDGDWEVDGVMTAEGTAYFTDCLSEFHFLPCTKGLPDEIVTVEVAPEVRAALAAEGIVDKSKNQPYAKERHMTDTTTTKPDTEVMPTTAIPSVMETEDHAAAGYYRICTSVRVGETWVCVEGFAHFDNQAEADAAAARVKVEVFA